jgi:V/A-type H+-transporting ATPase subunit C
LGRIETVLARGAGEQLLWIKKLAVGECRSLVEVALARADLHNCRILLRCFTVPGERGAEPLWHGYGILPVSFFSTLWKTSQLVDASERALSYGHPLAAALGTSLGEIGKGGGQMRAEKFLLRRLVEIFLEELRGIRGSNGEMLREYLGRLVDLWNLGVWLRRRRAGYRPETETDQDFLRTGAWLKVDRLDKVKTLRQLVHGTPWGQAVRNIESVSPQDFQRELQIHFWKWQLGLFRKDPLSIGVALGFIAMQIVEWNNLNTIAVGQTIGLSGPGLIQRLIPLGEVPGGAP